MSTAVQKGFKLSGKKRELLRTLLQKEGVEQSARAEILRQERNGPLPLSFAQQRLWFLDQIVAGNPFYVESSALRLKMPLNVSVLERTLNEIVRRHETLRTTFHVVDGRPMQVIAPGLTLPLRLMDLRRTPKVEREAQALAIATEEAKRPFDLTRGPLIRSTLLQLAENDYVFLLTMHHIICDGWSVNVFSRELSALYLAFSTGQPSPLPELSIQYADFAVWQREWLRDDVLAEQLNYWKQQLSDLPSLQLPTDYPRPKVASYKGNYLDVILPESLVTRLNALAREEGVTLFMLALAAFQALLSRYTGQTDVVVGSPIANRGQAALEELIGFFVNTLVLRCDLSGDPPFRELLRRVKNVCVGAYAHQDLPFEKLVEELQPERDLSRNPLFQVIFQLGHGPDDGAERSNGSSHMELRSETAKFDLRLDMWEQQGSITCRFEYSTDLFNSDTIKRLAGHFQTLLKGIVENPAQRLASLPVLTRPERRQLLVDWSGSTSDYPRNSTVQELFEAQVRKTPNAPAVQFGDRKITYAELNRRSNQLAHRLQRSISKTETPIGVCLERSVEMIVCFLAILKAGGAYVPLDPTYPEDRLAFMIDDARMPLVITREEFLPQVAMAQDRLLLDREEESIAREPGSNPAGPVAATNLAYVMYTSGSTGLPKGTCINHRSIVRLVRATNYVEIQRTDRIAQVSNAAFDALTFEVWGALLNGALLIGFTRDEILSASEFAKQLHARGITTLFLTTALFNQIANEAPGAFGALHTLKVGGSALDAGWMREVLRNQPPQRLLNVYGPTENTTYSTFNVLDELADGITNVPIGRAISNSQCFVLDSHMQPVPIGIPGELYLGGDGLARGYFNRRTLTADKFVPNPFSVEPGERLYSTGDLVRYRADGLLEFLGRVDQQIKIRGFRVELEEIEAVLRQHPMVNDAVVLAHEDKLGDKRLTAYVVTATDDQSKTDSAWDEHRVSQWQRVYDEVIYNKVYSQPETATESTFNTAGWNSSYTGQPLPAADMHEQVEGTVARILATGPRRVLEIGCGTGLLLFRVAPHCERYVGTDFSVVALQSLRQQLAVKPELVSHVTLLERTAGDFTGFEPGSFDAIVLNSVIQYFPGVDYLIEVLEGCLELLAPNGVVFIGDVRSLPLLKAFHASVELYHALDSLPLTELKERLCNRLNEEQELVVAPEFFHALRHRFPQISRTETAPKHGRNLNELSMFRYDVRLHVNEVPLKSPVPSTCSWNEAGSTVANLRAKLRTATKGAPLLITGIPNARIVKDIKALDLLENGNGSQSVAQLRASLNDADEGAVDPDDVLALGSELSHDVQLRWSSDGPLGSFDALFSRRRKTRGNGRVERAVFEELKSTSAPLESYANNPREGRFAQNLVPQLRNHLKTKLPDYMVPASYVILDELPISPNGKVDRQLLTAPTVSRSQLEQAYAAPSNEVEERLVTIWSQVLGLADVGVRDNFFELGGDSILTIQIIARAKEAGLKLTPQQLFQYQTIAELAAVAASAPAVSADQGQVTGDVPLTPIQHWFFEQNLNESHHFNQAVLLHLEPGIKPALVEQSVIEVFKHHDALNMRFRNVGPSWQQTNELPDARGIFEHVKLAGQRDAEQRAAIERMATAAQSSLNLKTGPLARVILFDLGRTKPARLLIVIHHLVVDGVSWRILLEDFGEVIKQLAGKQPVALPAKTTSYKQWAERLTTATESAFVRGELDYWLSLSGSHVEQLPRDSRKGANTVASVETIETSLSAELTEALLRDVPAAYSTQINEALLTALLRAFYDWTGDNTLLIDLEGHGREHLFDDVDLSRTVGWFTSIFPVLLKSAARGDSGQTLREVKEQLRQIPNHGIGFGMLRYLQSDAVVVERLQALPQPEVNFNYLGQFGQGSQTVEDFQPTRESIGPLRSLSGVRRHLLEISASISRGRLEVIWLFSRNLHRRETIQTLATSFIEQLQALIAHCQAPDAGGFTPSDFARARINQTDLDKLLSKLS